MGAAAAEIALAIHQIINTHWKVDFWSDEDAQKAVINDIDDYLHDELKARLKVSLSLEHMDEIIGKAMKIAKSRRRA